MKSSPAHNLGNVNLKGKKYKLFRCRCCAAIDLRDKELKKIHDKEIKERGQDGNAAVC